MGAPGPDFGTWETTNLRGLGTTDPAKKIEHGCPILTAFYAVIAVLQLLYTEATAAEWLFPQEKATLHGLKRAASIGEPL
jgi:hypothetical protein